MVSRSETARALLTQGEIMQLPDTDEIVMLAGAHPIRAKKARYYADPRLKKRIESPPVAHRSIAKAGGGHWDGMLAEPLLQAEKSAAVADWKDAETEAECGIRREPELPEHEDIAAAPAPARNEFEFNDRPDDGLASHNRRLADRMRANARRAALDPDDGIEL